MIDLYTAATPNGHKASILLEELGVPYTLHAMNLGAQEQKAPEYLKLNPNGRIPTIVDQVPADGGGPFAVFESGAILLYLADKYGRFIGEDLRTRSEVVQWLMFQMGGIGPMQGQANVFYRYFPEKLPSVISRYQNETLRLYGVLETRLEGRQWLCGTGIGAYSIADIANFTWVSSHAWAGLSVADLPNVSAWLARIAERPAVVRGLSLPKRAEESATIQSAQSILIR